MHIFHGKLEPFGCTRQGKRYNYALCAPNAKGLSFAIFRSGAKEPQDIIPLKMRNGIWHVGFEGDFGPDARYCLITEEGSWVFDPFAKAPLSSETWGEKGELLPLSLLDSPPNFDWEEVTSPKIPLEELIIYEMHVRGFTAHASSEVAAKGTFEGLIAKIPYLKKLGITAIELMPIFDFNEQKPLNYWGYHPIHFFFPMRRYASQVQGFGPVEEFQRMVKELHRNGIEVILDVVYNHTGESIEHFYHLEKIDRQSFYLLDEEGNFRNESGCGNTLNTNSAACKALILESLRYWTQMFHIDGFRFDLASIFTRTQEGEVLTPSPLLAEMAKDPILKTVKLIAEAWDAAGLYQVGLFPKMGPWSEWNGAYRDIVRRFIKGDEGCSGEFASALTGSEFLYGESKTPLSSINFITAHDGFTLRDLVSYSEKHNEENGENNLDGSNDNISWNCGVEGDTEDPDVLFLREKQRKNFLLALFVSQGIPMLLMGDEYGHTRGGNNNSYRLDNEKNWFLWDVLEKNGEFFSFVQGLIAFQKGHPSLKSIRFLSTNDIEWHGRALHQPSWDLGTKLIVFSLKKQPELFIAFNASNEAVEIEIPPNHSWKEIVNTEKKEHFLLSEKNAPTVEGKILLTPYSSLLLKNSR